MRRTFGPVVLMLVTLPTASLKAGGIQLPRLFNPPPPRAQVADAQIWDPYILPDMGFPVDGTRPRDFAPQSEVTRGRQPLPGSFPRPNPQYRSWAPVDYPNIGKRLRSSRRTWKVVDDAPAAPAAQSSQPAE
jgi:hypothetical protein